MDYVLVWRAAACHSWGLGVGGWVLRKTQDKNTGGKSRTSVLLSSNPQFPNSSLGFTLLEVLVAMAVLAVALVSLLGLYNRSLLLTIRAQHLSTATLLVQEMVTRTQLEGMSALRATTGDFADLHPGQYPEFHWYRTIRPTALTGLWELRVGVSWGGREEETCELTLFTPLEGS
jgi:general secretion pathway protein I